MALKRVGAKAESTFRRIGAKTTSELWAEILVRLSGLAVISSEK